MERSDQGRQCEASIRMMLFSSVLSLENVSKRATVCVVVVRREFREMLGLFDYGSRMNGHRISDAPWTSASETENT